MKEIVITVNKCGKIEIDFNGFQGNTCFKEREKLFELLRKYGINASVSVEVKKPEYYEEVAEEVKVEW